MSSEKKKNTQLQEIESTQKSKGLNAFLWILVIAIIALAAWGNIYFATQYSMPIRVAGIAVLLVVALGVAAMTNQGKQALAFFSESKTEVKRITWPSRPEAMQTTLIVIGVTVLISLILWGFDRIIVSLITFLTDLRF